MAASTALLWGVLAIALEVALAWVPAVTIVWFRFVVAFATLALYVALRTPRRLAILVRPPPLALLSSLALTGNYIGFMYGVDLTSPSNAQVLIQLAPLLLALAGVLCFGERLTGRQLLFGLVAASGLALFLRDQGAALDDSAAHQQLAGDLWVVFAAVSWAVYAALQKLLVRRGSSPQDLNLVLYLVPALALLPFVEPGPLAALTAGQWALMLFLGLNTLLAYGALAEALQRLPAHEVSVIIVCNPLITLFGMGLLSVLDVAWIQPDHVGPAGYFACGVVLVGVLGFLRR